MVFNVLAEVFLGDVVVGVGLDGVVGGECLFEELVACLGLWRLELRLEIGAEAILAGTDGGLAARCGHRDLIGATINCDGEHVCPAVLPSDFDGLVLGRIAAEEVLVVALDGGLGELEE